MIAAGRPFWPLFLHVLGAMTLVGAVFAVLLLALTAWRRPDLPVLARSAFRALLGGAIPSYVLMRAGAGWIYSSEGFTGHNDPTWLGIGFGVADTGLIVLLLTTGAAFWWERSGRPVAGRLVAGFSSLYLVLLAVAWLAMSGKWVVG